MQQGQQVLVGGVGRDCWRVVHRLLSRGRDSGTGDCAVPGLLLLKEGFKDMERSMALQD